MNNFIMEDNNDEQIEEASPEQFIIRSKEHEVDLNIQICKKIIARIPANQLRATHRPDKMVPRTFFNDRPFHLLPPELNEPAIEETTEVGMKKLSSSTSECGNQTMEEYFARTKCISIYNKLESYRADSRYFTGKLKGLDSMTDYNWKSFKELQSSPKPSQYVSEDSIDSDFQAGNLCRAYLDPSDQSSYLLLIENDLNTYGYNIWFFFRFRIKEAGTRRFSIINCIKETPFFNQGMGISIFSVKQFQERGKRWFKGGNNITFGKNGFIRNHHDMQYYCSLSFQHTFSESNDEVYFSLNQPYTYSRLVSLLSSPRTAKKDIIMEVKTVCYSVANNIVPLVHFYKEKQPKEQVILILARQHPCETVGSFIAEAIIQELAKAEPMCHHLLEDFQFYIIPMVNPDGVIHGMSRTNMAGLDLNRQWSQHSLKEMTPQTTKIQQFISQLTRSKKIKYMIDLHGHGKSLNSFCFCCKSTEVVKDNYRLFSFAMKKLEDCFNLSRCTYGITKDKETTLRSKIHSMGIRHSYTLETSQFGWKNDTNQILHFNESDFYCIGRNLLKSIFLVEGESELTQQYLGLSRQALLAELQVVQDVLYRQQKVGEVYDALSDSDPEGDRLDVKDLLSKCQNKLIKKKIQQNYHPNQVIHFKTKTRVNTGVSQGKKEVKPWQQRQSMTHNMYRQTNSNLMKGRTVVCQPPKARDSKQARWGQKKNASLSREKTTKKIVFPLKINKTIQSDHIENPVLKKNPKKQSRINTQPTSRERILLSSSLSSASEHNVNRLPCTHPKKKEKHQMGNINEGSKYETPVNIHLRFKELKKESLNYILTETISIMKIGRQRQESARNSSLRDSCTQNIDEKAKRHCHTTLQRQSIDELEERPESRHKVRTNYKNFLLKEGRNLLNRNKQLNSVYYHFPVL